LTSEEENRTDLVW